MAEVIQRRFYPGTKKCEALLRALNLYKEHLDRFDEKDVEEIEDFITDLGGKHLVQMRLQELFSEAEKRNNDDPVPFIRESHTETTGFPDPTKYADWETDDLKHHLWAYEDKMIQLPHDHVQAIKQELEIRRVREEEQKPRSIRPPQPTED